ncbi:hypothetical protein Bca52824_008990 [Brassica carinata]|uniref:Uncharacterized protein n=1 Tax=Brassica carinata TaxID=52824 RepID=A0A8X8B9S1_BRACI|nr:hypothetical protein Bca52824_008990 [Brassica carinata]
MQYPADLYPKGRHASISGAGDCGEVGSRYVLRCGVVSSPSPLRVTSNPDVTMAFSSILLSLSSEMLGAYWYRELGSAPTIAAAIGPPIARHICSVEFVHVGVEFVAQRLLLRRV